MYIMNATITPNSILPSMASAAPTTHTTTYPKLPMKFMSGIIRPDRNWLFQPDTYRSLLYFSNCSMERSSPQYALTTVWPVYISSTWPLTSPSATCWRVKYFCDTFMITPMMIRPSSAEPMAHSVMVTLL